MTNRLNMELKGVAKYWALGAHLIWIETGVQPCNLVQIQYHYFERYQRCCNNLGWEPTPLGGGQGQPKIHHLDRVGHRSNFDCYGSSNMSTQSAGVKTLWVLGPCPIGWGGFDPKTFPGPGNFYYFKSFTMLNARNLLENRGMITPCWRWLVDNFAWFIPFRLQSKHQHLTKLYMERLSFN